MMLQIIFAHIYSSFLHLITIPHSFSQLKNHHSQYFHAHFLDNNNIYHRICYCFQVGCILSDGTDFRLGKWMDRQRQKQRDGTLSKDREALLQTLVDDGRYHTEWLECTYNHNPAMPYTAVPCHVMFCPAYLLYSIYIDFYLI